MLAIGCGRSVRIRCGSFGLVLFRGPGLWYARLFGARTLLARRSAAPRHHDRGRPQDGQPSRSAGASLLVVRSVCTSDPAPAPSEDRAWVRRFPSGGGTSRFADSRGTSRRWNTVGPDHCEPPTPSFRARRFSLRAPDAASISMPRPFGCQNDVRTVTSTGSVRPAKDQPRDRTHRVAAVTRQRAQRHPIGSTRPHDVQRHTANAQGPIGAEPVSHH